MAAKLIEGVCKECKDRKIGCHGSCERYIQEQKDRQTEKDKIRQNKLGDAQMDAYYKVKWRNKNRRKYNG